MTWFFLSVGAAFCMASNAAYLKRYFSDVSSWDMCVIPFLYSMPLCAIALCLIDVPELGPGFFPALYWVTPMTMLGIILQYRAVHVSPLSLTLPFLSFTPVFVLFTGDFILKESLSSIGVVGMLLVVVGGYVINLDSTKYGLLGPIKAIWREPGSALMIVVAALYAMSSVGGKLMIINSSPLFTGMLIFWLLGILIPLILIGTGKASWKTVTRKPLLGLGSGVIVVCEIICHNLAMSMIAAAYMITIKRMTGFFSVFYGWFLFGERGIKYRVIGTTIMTLGAAFIALFG